MKRMTERGEAGNAYYPQCFKEPCEGMGCKLKQCKFSEAACDRLAAYEDSKLSTEDAANLNAILRLGDGMTLMRLRELAVADQEGRMVVLPCKVGDTVFALLDNKSKYVSECEVKRIGLGDNIGFATIVPVGYSQEYGVSLRGFGKTVFLTREEAEKALAEMEGKDD